MDKPKLRVTWVDGGKEPKRPPNPNYPEGIDIELRDNLLRHGCHTSLPYPAKQCGYFLVECLICGQKIVLTTAGRVDDPRSVTMECKLQ